MRQSLCILTALLLSACTPPSSFYDGTGAARLQASPSSCASQGQQFDNDSQACFTPSPLLPTRAVSSGAPMTSPASASNDDTIDVPIEPNAVIKNDLRRNAKLLSELVGFVLENGYRCDTISGLRAYVASRRFQLVCNDRRLTYEIEARDRRWIVTTK